MNSRVISVHTVQERITPTIIVLVYSGVHPAEMEKTTDGEVGQEVYRMSETVASRMP